MTAVQHLITDHLDLWTTAIKHKSSAGRGSNKKIELYGIKKLRELILELAVRGLLVPQDPSDEPASELLKKIAAERAQLVKTGKIKKSKPQPPIGDDEKPFQLPKGWEYCRLEDILQISSGNGLTAANMRENGNVPVFGGNGVTGYHDEGNVSKETLVIGRVGFYCGSIHITPELAWVTDNAFITTFSETNIYLQYLFWLLKGTNLKEDENATAQPVISGRKVYPIVVALAPKSEQHRIVAKVDELMQLCDQLEQQTESSINAHQVLVEQLLTAITKPEATASATALELLFANFDSLFTTAHSIDQLKQSILQLAVMGKLVPQDPTDEPASELLKKIAAEKAQLIKAGKIKKSKPLPPIRDEEKPFTLPKGWDYCKLDMLSLTSDAGWSPKCDEVPRSDNNWGVLKVSAVTWGIFRPSENKALPKNLQAKPEFEVKTGDFLISRANTAELVARSVVVSDDAPKKLMMSDKIIRFTFNKHISTRYVSMFNNSQFARAYYLTVAGGTSSSMKNVSRFQIQSLVVPCPPSAEQHRIVAKIDELTQLCDKLKVELESAQNVQLHLTDAVVNKATE